MSKILTKFLLVFSVLILCCNTSIARGFDFKAKASNGIYIFYKIISIPDRTIEVSFNNRKPSSYEGFIEIPDTVKYKDVTYTVTAIGDSAFYNCYELNGVRIPSTVTSIGESAFDASRIRTIEFSEGLKFIGDFAFRQCTQLQGVNFPKSLERIGKGAFIFCTNLYELNITNNIREIGVSAFYGCNKITSILIPENLEFIGENAFFDCNNLSAIDLESKNCNLTNNFSNRGNIKKIVVGRNVESISDGAFAFNENLTEVSWLSEFCSYSGKTSIFEGCNNLRTINIGEDVIQLPLYFAKSCSGLSEITIPTNIKKIGKEAFAYCQNLSKLTFNAKNCSYESSDAFVGDSSLTEVIIDKNVKIIPNGFLNGCVNIKDVNIPETVTSIGEKAFKNCENIKTFVFSENIQSIGKDAFVGCSNLESVSCKATNTPKVDGDLGWSDDVKIYIPCAYIYYYNNADFWKEQRFECDTTVAVATKSESEFYDIDSKKNGENFYFKITSKSRRTISLVKYFSDGNIDEIVIPSSVAWEGGTYTVTAINGNKVFEDVYTDIIEIPSSITSISADAFLGIKSLKFINVDESNKAYSSENGVLYNKDKSILLCHPSSSSAVFNVPSSVVSIESNAFGVARDNNLKSIRIPASVIAIGENAFSACTGLKDISIDEQNNAYAMENGILYDKKKTTIIAVCPAYFMSNEFTIPKNVKAINNGAFKNWENLKTINSLPSVPPTLGDESFLFTENFTIIVPKASYSKYKTANYWKDCVNLKYAGMKTPAKKK